MRSSLAPALVAAVVATGCGPAPKAVRAPEAPAVDLPPAQDAPFELADDQDLETVRHRYEALPPDAAERPPLRQRLAEEYARRIDESIGSPRRRGVAYEALVALAGLWRTADLDDQDRTARQLAPYAPQARAVLDSFSRSGGDREAVTALVILMAMHPDRRDAYIDELETIFAYTDELARARFGEGAEHARTIQLLENAVEALPIDWAVDRLIALYVARQKAIHEHFDSEGADYNLVRAHGKSVLRTVWHIARILARAGRIAEAPAAIAEVSGIGSDDDVRAHLERALSADATPGAWVVLAADFRGGDPDESDPYAALAVLREGRSRFPQTFELTAATGRTARDLDNIPLAIRHFERAAELEPADRDVAENLAELYELRVANLVFNDRPNAAREHLEELERFHVETNEQWPAEPLGSDLAEAYKSMGHGLVSLGQLDEGRRYLELSLERRPTYGALRYLGTVALKQDRYDEAIAHLERALELPNQDPNQLFSRATILRLAGDAHAGSDNGERARAYRRAALRTWDDLVSRVGDRLQPRSRGEALTETGRLRWALGEHDEAIEAMELAVDVDPDGANTHATVVSFFITHDRYERALDAYHRALGSYEIGEYFKVYMSLWILAEAQRTGGKPDPLALDYLRSRDGRLWYDDLARYATGRLELERVEERATSRARRAELLYYAAVLSDADQDPKRVRKLLHQVVATDMVLFFEYDMARHWLAEGFGAPASAQAD